MVISDGLKEIDYEGPTRIVIGKFEGIHAGHQKLIKEITLKKDSLKALVFTFTFSSDIYKENNTRILSDEERHEKFKELGVDYLIEYELNKDTLKTEPEEFAREILKKRLHCEEIVCGSDLSFGYKGRGNVELLKSMEDELHIKVRVIDKVKYLGEDISSTRIREAIKAGDMDLAQKMLN